MPAAPPDKPPFEKNAELSEKIADVQRDAGRYLERISFAGLLEELNRHVHALESNTSELARLRARGYCWRGDLELQLAAARDLAPETVRGTREATAAGGQALRGRVDELAREAKELARRSDLVHHESAVRSLVADAEGIDRAIDGVEARVRALITPFSTPITQVTTIVKNLHWTLDQFEGASFKLVPQESVIGAASVTWENPPEGEKQKGILYFTDLRVRFEQKEEVVTKKLLFVFAAEKKLVQALRIDEPVGHMVASEDSTRGWVIKDQLLSFVWVPAARCPKLTTFELESGAAKDWDEVVESIRAGSLDRYRYTGIVGQTAAGAMPVRWPEKCQTCGAAMEPPVKGQTVMICGYCGQSHDVTLSPSSTPSNVGSAAV